MKHISRQIEPVMQRALDRGKSVLLLGPRQTGKTTLMNLVPKDLLISLVKPAVRLRYEKDASLLEKEIASLQPREGGTPVVCLDEIQKVPILLDAVQDLIDEKKAQ